ncbi:MAG: hypothetical protein HZA78_02635 [Candidatus Schekmanbacteria bacterium]|nr:hypothetical protein [Candidatus Schekmanbacteria bacterium]
MKVKVKKGVLKPIGGASTIEVFKEDEEVEIEIKSPKKFSWRGALADMKISSVDLQHKIKDRW